MHVSRGKGFEECIRNACERVPDTSVIRLIDPQAGYAGVRNICDFIVYHYPMQFFLECKSVHGNTFSISSNDEKKLYGNITNNQWEGMLEQSHIRGVVAGVLLWFVDHDVTVFVSIQDLDNFRRSGHKSVNIKDVKEGIIGIPIPGRKKRVMFDYDMDEFLHYQIFTKNG